MTERIFRSELRLSLPREEVFAFFADAANLERITPPELRFRITSSQPVLIGPGARIDYSLRLFSVPFSWSTLISKWDPPNEFVDEQLRGPYKQWIHTHRFVESGGETVISDEVRYVLPFGALGLIAAPIVGLQVRRIFHFREAAIRKLLGPTESSLPAAS